jgi:DnaJ-class molecular chaperone
MYDLSFANDQPGTCGKCSGSGLYRWGAVVNGQATKSGPCHSCAGTGQQDARQIARNHAYNRHKIAMICEAA